MSAENWKADPADARWYGCVIAEPVGGGDTDYFDGYSTSETRPSWRGLVPTGWRKLEASVRMTPQARRP